MSAIASKKPVVQLAWKDHVGTLVITDADESRFAVRIADAIVKLRAEASRDVVKEQFDLFFSEIQGWIEGRGDVSEAYVCCQPGEMVLLVVTNLDRYNAEFEDALSDFDMKLSNDPELDKLNVSVMSLPRMPSSALACFLPETSFRFHGGLPVAPTAS